MDGDGDEEHVPWLSSMNLSLRQRIDANNSKQEFQKLGKLLKERVGPKGGRISKQTKTKRRELFQRYRSVVSRCRFRKKGVNKVTLHYFGSEAMGLATKDSDIDLSIEGVEGSPLSHLRKNVKRDILRRAVSGLRREIHGEATYLLGARVPLIRFVDRYTKIKCDLTAGNPNSVFGSSVIGEILKSEPKFLKLVVLVKLWAKSNGINDGSMGTIGSFSLTMLVITYLQHRRMLSPIKDIVPEARAVLQLQENDEDILQYLPEQVQIAKRWVSEAKHKQNPIHNVGLAELFVDFLHTFGFLFIKSGFGGTFGDEIVVASPWNGKFEILKPEGGRSLPFLMVEDPFNPDNDCMRAVRRRSQAVSSISSAIETALLAIERNLNRGKWSNINSICFAAPSPRDGDKNWPSSRRGKKLSLFESIKDSVAEDIIAGVSVDMPLVVDLSWCSKGLLTITQDIVAGVGKGLVGWNKVHFVIDSSQDPLHTAADWQITQTVIHSRQNLNILQTKFESLAESSGDFPIDLHAEYHSKAVLDSVIMIAERAGFTCRVLENGFLRFEGYRALASSAQQGIVDDLDSLHKLLLIEAFKHFVTEISAIPLKTWIEFRVDDYLIPAKWVLKVMAKITTKFLKVECVRRRKTYRVRLLQQHPAPNGTCDAGISDRTRNMRVSALASGTLPGSLLCPGFHQQCWKKSYVQHFMSTSICRRKMASLKPFRLVACQSCAPSSLQAVLRLRTPNLMGKL